VVRSNLSINYFLPPASTLLTTGENREDQVGLPAGSHFDFFSQTAMPAGIV
jgi:hypothetical protein